MNILEPVVEISDQPKDNSRKRKGKENSLEPRKKGKPNSNKASVNHVGTVRESEFVNVSIKQEPSEQVPVDVSSTVPMATIPVANTSASSVPVYVYVPQPQPVVLQPTVEYSVQNTNNDLLNQSQNRNCASTSAKTNNSIHSEVEQAPNIKQEQEEMENVFVMPFGADFQSDATLASEKPPSSQAEIIECDLPEEMARKNRKAAIIENIGAMSSSSSHKKLRDLTFKLVELNNKNLQCDSRIDKIKEEFRKRLQVVEIEKKGIEQEIDRVLAYIQEWKENRR